MKTAHQVLHERLLVQKGLTEVTPPKFKPEDLKKLEHSERSSQFERLMRNRLLMGVFRYGTFEQKRRNNSKKPWDLLGAVKSKIESYSRTGNTEYLVDCANYLMLAFEFDPTQQNIF